jgi:hypothetical protein
MGGMPPGGRGGFGPQPLDGTDDGTTGATPPPEQRRWVADPRAGRRCPWTSWPDQAVALIVCGTAER